MPHLPEMPLGKIFSDLAKDYLGTFSKRLEHLPINRYHYPLLVVFEGGGKLSQQCLANELQVDKVAVVRMVDYLSENGLVRRKQNSRDRREQLLQLTPAGEKLIPEIRQAMIDTNQLATEGFSAEETCRLEKLLSKMLCNLRQQPQNSFHVEIFKSDQ